MAVEQPAAAHSSTARGQDSADLQAADIAESVPGFDLVAARQPAEPSSALVQPAVSDSRLSLSPKATISATAASAIAHFTELDFAAPDPAASSVLHPPESYEADPTVSVSVAQHAAGPNSASSASPATAEDPEAAIDDPAAAEGKEPDSPLAAPEQSDSAMPSPSSDQVLSDPTLPESVLSDAARSEPAGLESAAPDGAESCPTQGVDGVGLDPAHLISWQPAAAQVVVSRPSTGASTRPSTGTSTGAATGTGPGASVGATFGYTAGKTSAAPPAGEAGLRVFSAG